MLNILNFLSANSIYNWLWGFFFSNAINKIIVTSVLRPVLEELQKYSL